ncbi:hypothetical protein [Nocardioides sp. P5_C9_2]
MTGTLRIEWTSIESMLQSMVDVGLQAGEIDTYFQEHVVNTAGLDYPTCALKPIGDQLPKLGTAFSTVRTTYQRRWVEMISSIAQSAAELNRVDHEIDVQMGRYSDALDAMPDVKITVKAFEPQDLSQLEAPEESEGTLKHNSTWEMTSKGYDATRDGINDAIDFLNGLHVPGVHLPTLPKKSLEDYIVYPLAGNYRLLGANADACSKIDTAFSAWAFNFTRLSGQVHLAMEGQTSMRLMVHLNLYAAVMKTVGEIIGQGSTAFGAISRMSEKIAVAVENALVKMATKLTKLLSKLSSKLSPAGWVWFSAELVQKGFSAVTDIYDDIMECKDIIEACFGLAEEIKAWAGVMSDALRTMQEIRDAVEQLPTINPDGGLSGLPHVDLPAYEKTLGEIGVEVETGSSDEEESLNDRLEDLEGETAQPDEEDDEDHEDENLMAPGPLYEVPVPGAPTDPGPMTA